MSLALTSRRAALLPGRWVSNELWRRARAVPSLDLRFAENKSLVDSVSGQSLITFTRASTGTYVDSDGVIRSAATNLLLRSEEFDNASWTRSGLLAFGSGSTANAATAPNGTTTADLLVESTAINSERNAYQSGIAATTGTLTVYAKASGRSHVGLRFYAASDNWVRATYTLSGAGAASAVSAGSSSDYSATSAGIEPLANGWYRVRLTATRASGLQFAVIDFATTASPVLAASSGNEFYTGDGTSGLLLWGAQLEVGSTATAYIPTGATINSAPRFDHNPLTGECLGLLVEEQRTNSLSNSTAQGAVAGSPGTAPTGWIVTGDVNGISRQIVGTGDDNGINYVDIRYSGTPTANGTLSIIPSPVNTIIAESGQTWTGSAFVKLQAGTLSNITTTRQGINGRASNGANVEAVGIEYTPTDNPLIEQRNTISITLASASSVRISTTVFAGEYSLGAPVDFTLRIGLPQLEQGAFATSVIPTTTAAATRTADVASITGTNFSSWYSQSEGTMFADASVAYSAAVCLFSLDDGTPNNRVQLRNSNLAADMRIVTAGVSQATLLTSNATTVNTRAKHAGSYKVNDLASVLNGGIVATQGTGSIPVATQAVISPAVGSNAMNGNISRLTYWPQRLPNSTLQSITL